jgi:small subunit ribosomal protein S17
MYTRRKSRVGIVTSDKMQKTIVVAVESHQRHQLYNKNIRRTTRYKVHDETDTAKLGDVVRIVECRPTSHDKRWKLAEVVQRREVAEVAPREIDAAMMGGVRRHTESAAAVAEARTEEPIAEVAEVAVEEEAPPTEAEAEAEPVAEEAPSTEAEAEAEPVAEQEEEKPEE